MSQIDSIQSGGVQMQDLHFQDLAIFHLVEELEPV
jgi:hypothetical protein